MGQDSGREQNCCPGYCDHFNREYLPNKQDEHTDGHGQNGQGGQMLENQLGLHDNA